MIYTKTGDDGTTSLVEGSRVAKDDPRVECYGTVDELNSHLGLLREMIHTLDAPQAKDYCQQLENIQNDLFVIQTLLATADATIRAQMPQLNKSAVTTMEGWIDEISAQLPPAHAFVIPGGSLSGAECHVARCVCRRAERRIVSLERVSPSELGIPQYINRLSDYLFVLSRRVLMLENKKENFWHAT